jgi:branched-chain amino acid aminotransferase
MPPAASPEPLAYLNGDWVPARTLSLPVHDAGFVWGATITDLCRTFRHRLYRWDDHLARFRRGCQYASIVLPNTDIAITTAATGLVEHNARLIAAYEDLALVLFATPGPIGYYAGLPGGAGEAGPTFGMHTFRLPFTRYRPLVQRGAHLVIPPTRRAEQEAHAIDPTAAALLLDLQGRVTETAAANFLIVERGAILSPARDTVLEGISLQVTRALCDTLKIPFEERPLTVDACLTADEALLTSTPYGVAGVSRINDRLIRWPGPVLRRLQDAWNADVGLNITEQILASA